MLGPIVLFLVWLIISIAVFSGASFAEKDFVKFSKSRIVVYTLGIIFMTASFVAIIIDIYLKFYWR